MNWSRGLFRLWLVISAIWIIAALLVTQTFEAVGDYLNGQSLRTNVISSELSVSPVENDVVTVTFEGRAFVIETAGVQPSQGDEWSEFLRAAALLVNQDAAINNAQRRRTKADILNGMWIATLPPLAMLLLGTSLLWAMRGFSGGREK